MQIIAIFRYKYVFCVHCGKPLRNCFKIAEAYVVLIVFNDVFYQVPADIVVVSYRPST